jgi:hypothetical protein
MRFVSKRGQNEENEKKSCVLQFEKMYFLDCSFLAGPLVLHFQDEL